MALHLPGQKIKVFYDTDRIPVYKQGTFKRDGSFWAQVIQSQQTRTALTGSTVEQIGAHRLGLLIPDRSVTPFKDELDLRFNWTRPCMALSFTSIQGYVLEELTDQPDKSLLITIFSGFGAENAEVE